MRNSTWQYRYEDASGKYVSPINYIYTSEDNDYIVECNLKNVYDELVNAKAMEIKGDIVNMLSMVSSMPSYAEDVETMVALCKSITDLYLPDGISDIGYYAFRDCTGLRKIVLPAGLKTLKRGVFAFCDLPDDLDITLNEGLETIQSGVFSSGGLNLFFTVKLPSSVKECAADAFEPGIKIISAE